MTVLELLKSQIESSRGTLESTMADVKKSLLNKDPGGKAMPIGAAYAHLVFSEDAIIQGMLQGKAPLHAGRWKTKTGASAPLPAFDDDWSASHDRWMKSVKVDLEQMQKYAKAVYKATDAYVAGLKAKDLTKELDLGAMGKRTVVNILSNFIIAHTDNLAGEISAIKGVFNTKGYPF